MGNVFALGYVRLPSPIPRVTERSDISYVTRVDVTNDS